MSAGLSAYQTQRREHERLVALAREREFIHDVSDVAKYMPMGVGLHPGQATIVTLHGGGAAVPKRTISLPT